MKLPEAAGLFLAFLARLITGSQGHWYGYPPKAEQRIYFANHQSWVLIWAALPSDLRSVTRPVARAISRSFSWRAWGIGAGAAAFVGVLLYWATPFKPVPALVMGFIAGGHGHVGRVRNEGAEA